MADAEYLLKLLEGGVGMFFDMGAELFRVELAPGAPTRFRRQRPLFDGFQIPVNGTPGQRKPPGGLGFGTAALNEFHHPFPQVQRIGFHARKPVSLCPNVNMKCYIRKLFQGRTIAPRILPPPVLADGFGRLVQPFTIRQQRDEFDGAEKFHCIRIRPA